MKSVTHGMSSEIIHLGTVQVSAGPEQTCFFKLRINFEVPGYVRTKCDVTNWWCRVQHIIKVNVKMKLTALVLEVQEDIMWEVNMPITIDDKIFSQASGNLKFC